jgi:hypothetical protein
MHELLSGAQFVALHASEKSPSGRQKRLSADIAGSSRCLSLSRRANVRHRDSRGPKADVRARMPPLGALSQSSSAA